MKVHFSVAVGLTMVTAQAIEQLPNYASAREYYQSAQFSKAAARFEVLCNSGNDADACYWAALSYEQWAATATPLGCNIERKAHNYYIRARKLSPAEPLYRDALFYFLLNAASCSRTALREAAALVSATPQSDPERSSMLQRLESARHLDGSADERLARLFLVLPRASYGTAARLVPRRTNDSESPGQCAASATNGAGVAAAPRVLTTGDPR